jgi:CubicO group peptidase (beta-lactamase class C family)
MTELVQALNSKSHDRIHGFLEQWISQSSNIEARTSRWMTIANGGAPFALLSTTVPSPEEIDAIVKDREGTRLVFKLHLQVKPELKLIGLQIAPAFRAEGASGDLGNWTDLSNLCRQILSKTHGTGMGVVVARHGVLNSGVSGDRSVVNGTSLRAGDVWSVGAIGKSICGSVIGRLAQDHKLNWNSTLRQLLPGVPMNSSYEKVTISQVLHHQGGFPLDVAVPEGKFRPNDKGLMDARSRYLKAILASKPSGRPGSKFIYSNAGYAALAAISERLTGKPYEKLVLAYVFEPLQLRNSFVGLQHLQSEVTGYREFADGLHAMEISDGNSPLSIGAGGCLLMSMGDLARYGQAHLDGLKGKNGFLRASTIVALHQGESISARGDRMYACGWSIERLPNLPQMHGHNGASAGHRVQMAIFPDADLVVAAAVNLVDSTDPSPGLLAAMAVAKRYSK